MLTSKLGQRTVCIHYPAWLSQVVLGVSGALGHQIFMWVHRFWYSMLFPATWKKAWTPQVLHCNQWPCTHFSTMCTLRQKPKVRTASTGMHWQAINRLRGVAAAGGHPKLQRELVIQGYTQTPSSTNIIQCEFAVHCPARLQMVTSKNNPSPTTVTS